MEYIVTVADPKVWDELWDELTVDGLGDNFIPDRAVGVINERPFNDYSAHFDLTDAEAEELRQDTRIVAVELQADQQDDVSKGFVGVRPALYDKSNSTSANMKNWGLLRCTKSSNPFNASSSINGEFSYNLNGAGVDIVVIDSGVEPDHPEFAVNPDGTGGSRVVDFDWSSLGVSGVYDSDFYGGYLGDSDGHGSNCASIAAGNTCGWAMGAAIYSIRIFAGNSISEAKYLDEINSDLVFDLVRAFHLKKLAEGNTRPTICTNSWGYSSSYSGMSYTVYRGVQYTATFRNKAYGQVNSSHPYTLAYINAAVDNASAAGVIMVGAAGNSSHKIDVPGGLDYDNYYRYYSYENVYYHRGMSPTSAPSMITVGAVDNSGVEQKAYFSEAGPKVSVYAPGTMIMGAYANKPYRTSAVADPRKPGFYLNKISGTSQAAPQVTGVLACVLQARPTMSPSEAKQFILNEGARNVLYEGSAFTYTDTAATQGGINNLLRMPFTNSKRGGITS